MKYLSGEEILVIHARIVDATGGSHGVRDEHLFLSLIEKPKATFGKRELYRGVFVKAAAYFESIASYHVFVDGNKRTSIGATARFLYMNGYKLMTHNKKLESFVLRVATEKIELKEMADWLKKYSKKK